MFYFYVLFLTTENNKTQEIEILMNSRLYQNVGQQKRFKANKCKPTYSLLF